jgi:hypothetical protein
VPYVNQDKEKPIFEGSLNGYDIDPDWKGRSAIEVCPPDGLRSPAPGTELETVSAEGPLQILPTDFGFTAEALEPPYAFLCGEDLTVVYWAFRVPAGTPDVNPGGSDLLITRSRGIEPLNRAAPEDRWHIITIDGHPAVASDPVVAAGDSNSGAVTQPCTRQTRTSSRR